MSFRAQKLENRFFGWLPLDFFLAVASFVRCEQDARRSELPAGQRACVQARPGSQFCVSVCVCCLSSPLHLEPLKVRGTTMCVRTGTGSGDGGKTQLFFAVFVAFPFFLSLLLFLSPFFYFLARFCTFRCVLLFFGLRKNEAEARKSRKLTRRRLSIGSQWVEAKGRRGSVGAGGRRAQGSRARSGA